MPDSISWSRYADARAGRRSGPGVIEALLPADVSAPVASVLIGLSMLTSMLTGALGLGGGVLMLAVLALLVPATVVVPVHGVVQIGSNLGRAALMQRHVDRTLIVPFAFGSILGVALAAPLVIALPRASLQLVLGLFILWSCWSPRLKPARVPAPVFVAVGVASSFATMFLGATGPFVAAFVSPDRLDRHGAVATHAACMTVQHGFKVGAFTAIGFPFLAWLPMLAAMIGSGFLGTVMGRRYLDRMPEADFARGFKLVLTCLALLLLGEALRNLAGY